MASLDATKKELESARPQIASLERQIAAENDRKLQL